MPYAPSGSNRHFVFKHLVPYVLPQKKKTLFTSIKKLATLFCVVSSLIVYLEYTIRLHFFIFELHKVFSLRKKKFSCQAEVLIIFPRQRELIRTLLGIAERQLWHTRRKKMAWKDFWNIREAMQMFGENYSRGKKRGKQDIVLHLCSTLCEWREGNLVRVYRGWEEGVEGQILTHLQRLNTIRDKLIRTATKWLCRT
jgi:hypothetical protein